MLEVHEECVYQIYTRYTRYTAYLEVQEECDLRYGKHHNKGEKGEGTCIILRHSHSMTLIAVLPLFWVQVMQDD